MCLIFLSRKKTSTMQEKFYSVQKACFYVCPGAQANEGVAFLQEIHGTFPFQWRRTGRTFGGPFFFDIFLARRSFAKRVPAALAFTFFRGARTTRSIARAFGSLLAWHIGACTSGVSLSFTTPTAIGCTGVISAVETSTSFGALPPLTDTWTLPHYIRDTESMHP